MEPSIDAPAAQFGRRLRQMRAERDLTIEDLAHRADLAASTVYRFEAGKLALPRADTLDALANALGVSADYLLGRSDVKTIAAISRDGEVAPEPLIRIPLIAAGNTTDGGVIDVPRMLLPADVPPEHLVVAYADLDAPDDIPEGTMVIADRTDTGPGDGALVIAEVAGEIVVREHYAAGEMRLLMGREGRADRVPPTAILGRAVRAITIRDCGDTTQR